MDINASCEEAGGSYQKVQIRLDYAASKERKRRVYYTGRCRGRTGIHSTQATHRQGMWFKRQTGQDRHSRHSSWGSLSSNLTVIFPPLMQYECYLEVLPLTFPLGVFCSPKNGFFSVYILSFYHRNQSAWTHQGDQVGR